MNLALRYSTLLEQIHSSAKEAQRDPTSIHLVAVTKHATLEQMHEAYDLGLRHFGENRLQAALEKMPLFPSDVHWHFIGPLQSNKIGKIVENFSAIHSVDSLEIAQHIAKKSERRPALFLEVNTSHEATKHGFTEQELLEQFDELLALDLNLTGLMTMAPQTSDLKVIRDCFHRLRSLRDALAVKKRLPDLSMGMSQDFPLAIAEGATYLRIGSQLFAN